MGYYKLTSAHHDLMRNLRRTEALASAAQQWTLLSTPEGIPRFSTDHMHLVTELAFLRSFLAWEVFLEESFVLFLLGKRAPKARPANRKVVPRSRTVAMQLMKGERDWADWTVPSTVLHRAERFFDQGEPFSSVLKDQQSKLEDIKCIRNALAHSSSYSREKFENLVRRELKTLPVGLTVGGFLSMAVPASSPPMSFLEYYIIHLRVAADRIVPS